MFFTFLFPFKINIFFNNFTINNYLNTKYLDARHSIKGHCTYYQ